MTPAERVTAMLTGNNVDRIPLTAYENKVTYGRDERELRNDGMCIVMRPPPSYLTLTPSCDVRQIRRQEGGTTVMETVIDTPQGRLSSVDIDRGAQHNAWQQEHLFKSEDDYPALSAYSEDLRYEENYNAVELAMERCRGDCFFRGSFGYSPMHHIIYRFMGLERFSYEWADNRSRILELYEILAEKRMDLAQVAAASPKLAFNICGNVTAPVVSPAMYEQYYLPIYNRIASILHDGGKLCGIHFDGITLPFAELIARTEIDYVEALTPPPTCDVSVAQAHELWPDKAIWINFPSSVHLESEERIRETAQQLLSECKPERRFLLGITEDVPPDRWPVSFRIILDEVNAFSGAAKTGRKD